jgi:two-component system nitrate/nitrite response regulator NarL
VLCDQHVAFAESLAHVLIGRGNDVDVVPRVNDAVAIVAREPVDLCLVGAAGEMPDLDGLTALGASGVAVVLLATEVSAHTRSRAIAAGVRAVATKQQSLGEILRLIDRVNAGERIVDSAAARRSSMADQPRRRTEGQHLAAFLSPRERQVLCALVRGEDTGTLARSLGISSNTARSHVQSVLTKLNAHSRLAAVRAAVHGGMVDPRTGDWLLGNSAG